MITKRDSKPPLPFTVPGTSRLKWREAWHHPATTHHCDVGMSFNDTKWYLLTAPGLKQTSNQMLTHKNWPMNQMNSHTYWAKSSLSDLSDLNCGFLIFHYAKKVAPNIVDPTTAITTGRHWPPLARWPSAFIFSCHMHLGILRVFALAGSSSSGSGLSFSAVHGRSTGANFRFFIPNNSNRQLAVKFPHTLWIIMIWVIRRLVHCFIVCGLCSLHVWYAVCTYTLLILTASSLAGCSPLVNPLALKRVLAETTCCTECTNWK